MNNNIIIDCPCDLYGRNAVLVRDAVRQSGGIEIEHMGIHRCCNATSLIGLLSLGVHKGDKIRLLPRSESQDISPVLAALKGLAS